MKLRYLMAAALIAATPALAGNGNGVSNGSHEPPALAWCYVADRHPAESLGKSLFWSPCWAWS